MKEIYDRMSSLQHYIDGNSEWLIDDEEIIKMKKEYNDLCEEVKGGNPYKINWNKIKRSN